MKNNTGILVLSHCGFSFLEDLSENINNRGFEVFVLSSLPLPENYPQRINEIKSLSEVSEITESHEISYSDVTTFIHKLNKKGKVILFCISVWEGYRYLMSRVNWKLGIFDIKEEQVMEVRDKLSLRKKLKKIGLSNIFSWELTPEKLFELKKNEQRYFIKPNYGIASYGAFSLTKNTNWAMIENIIENIKKDTLYTSVFNSGISFLIEEYIHGKEVSFEILIINGEVFIIAIHEKYELDEAVNTVLESCCVSPPVSLTHQQCAAGINWIKLLISRLEIQWGCFHIEARCDNQCWELIEINPRIGGSLISHSVKFLTQQKSLLELWLDLLLILSSNNPAALNVFADELSAISYQNSGIPTTDIATFFRVYFARSGKLEKITLRPLLIEPVIKNIILKSGDYIEPLAREVFLGQILWQFGLGDREQVLPLLSRISKDAIEINYTHEDKREDSISLSQLPQDSYYKLNEGPMHLTTKILLIIDYNLTRVGDVLHMYNYINKKYNARTFLIRPTPTQLDNTICDKVFDIDPLQPDFIKIALEQLSIYRSDITAGLVFSDNAVHSGALLLEHLGLKVDSAELAIGAFNKYKYRLSELKYENRLKSDNIMLPDFTTIKTIDDLYAFSIKHHGNCVIKPMCEGNNRGVTLISPAEDIESAFNATIPYLQEGVMCEQVIPYQREFSFDGIAQLHFITEKISARGPYPVELGQILPAKLTAIEKTTLINTGKWVNKFVGQQYGPFHNEIRISDNGLDSAVVEPNRRPGGMKIWSLAQWVYNIDLYKIWIDSLFNIEPPTTLAAPCCTAATVMLGVDRDIIFSPDDIQDGNQIMTNALKATAGIYDLTSEELTIKEFNWLSHERRHISHIPLDNADFAAQICITLFNNEVDIRAVINTLQERWMHYFGLHNIQAVS